MLSDPVELKRNDPELLLRAFDVVEDRIAQAA
jgi:hypothetical protein